MGAAHEGHGTRRVTNKVWKGILIVWEHPYLIEWLNAVHEDWDMNPVRLKEWGIKQKDIDCVLRAVDWAQAMEKKHGR